MKFIRKVFTALFVILVFLLVLAAFLPKDISATASKEIEAPVNVVYNIVNDVSTHESWSYWREQDENLVLTLGEKTQGPGASYTWTGENARKGSFRIIDTEPNKSINAEIKFEEIPGFPCPFTFQATDDGCKVDWTFSSKMYWPLNIFAWQRKRYIKKIFSADLELLEKIAMERYDESIYRGYEIQEVLLPEKHFITIRGEVKFENIEQFFGQGISSLYRSLHEVGVSAKGNDACLYYKWDIYNQIADMAVAIETEEAISVRDLISVTTSEGRAIQVNYYGDRDNIEDAHKAIGDYIKDHGLLVNIPVMERYVSDIDKEKDPEKWLTKIMYPIE